MVLLRAIVAPVLLMATVVLSFAAALGVSYVVFDVLFGFPGSDPSLPLFAFVFLVALGIDYNIFLMARVREETQKHGTREGMLRGLAVTGGVITSAGIVLAGTFAVLAVLPLVFLTETRVRDRVRRPARHVRRALDARAGARAGHRRAGSGGRRSSPARRSRRPVTRCRRRPERRARPGRLRGHAHHADRPRRRLRRHAPRRRRARGSGDARRRPGLLRGRERHAARPAAGSPRRRRSPSPASRSPCPGTPGRTARSPRPSRHRCWARIKPAVKRFTVTATDAATNTSATVDVNVANAVFSTSTGFKSPKAKRTWKFSGLFQNPGKPIYGHFRHGGQDVRQLPLRRPDRAVRHADAQGARHPGSRVPSGKWTVQVDFSRTLRPEGHAAAHRQHDGLQDLPPRLIRAPAGSGRAPTA